MTNNASGCSWPRLVASWALVLIPMGWGVSRSMVTSLPLLSSTDPRFAPTTEK